MKRSVLLPQLVASLALVLALAPPAQAASSSSTSDVWRFSNGQAIEGASSTLVRTGSGVSMTLNTIAPAGHAVTVWWVIFNNPESCTEGTDFRCGEADLFNPDVQGSVQYAAGRVVGKSGDYNVASYLSEGDTDGCPFAAPGDTPCAGLIDAQQADVHLVVRSHGEMLPEFMPGQIKSFEVACTPETSFGLGDGPNECADLQFAVHETI